MCNSNGDSPEATVETAPGAARAEPPAEPCEAPTPEAAPAENPPPQVEEPTGPSPEQVRLAELEARLRSVSSAYVALQDEMRAYQDRVRRMDEDKDRRRRGEAVTAIFEPVQNLRRSVDALKKADLPPSVVEGLELVLGQFVESLRRLGLEEIQAMGATFDPNVHEAMGTVMVTDQAQDGRVLHVYDVGYRIGSQVIQPARVIIGQYREPAQA